MGFARSFTKAAIRAQRTANARLAREANIAARKQSRAEANQAIREADRCVAWAREHGSPEELREAQALADQWRRYRDQL